MMTDGTPWFIMLITIGWAAVLSWNHVVIMTSKDPAKLLWDGQEIIGIFFDRLLLVITVFSLSFLIYRSWNISVLISDLFCIFCLGTALYTYWINQILLKWVAPLLSKDPDSN